MKGRPISMWEIWVISFIVVGVAGMVIKFITSGVNIAVFRVLG